MEEGHQLTKDESVGVRLKSLPSPEIDLGEKDEKTIPLKANGHPAVALMEVLRSLMGQVLGECKVRKPPEVPPCPVGCAA